MDASAFWSAVKEQGFTFFSGVPDSTFGKAYNAMVEDPDIRYVPAVREDSALGVASAAHFVGRRGGVIMQNSGLGNIVNALTSFNLIYKVPVLLLVGWRGYGGPPHDAPEHWIMGPKTPDILDILEVPYAVLEEDNLEEVLESLVKAMDEESIPAALLVRKGIIA